MRKMFISVAVMSVLVLTGCASPTTPENPSAVGQDRYSLDYVQVGEKIITCLFKSKNTNQQTLSCDWNNTVTSSEAPEKVTPVGEGGYRLEYIKVDGRVIGCLFKNKNTNQQVMSCDWDSSVI